MRALCYKCGHSWNYKGKQREKEHLSCSRCSYRLVAEKALLGEDENNQIKLHNFLHNSPLELHKEPPKIHTYIHKKKDFIEVEKDIFVEKKIAKQFKEAKEDPTEEGIFYESIKNNQRQNQEQIITILPPKYKIIRVIPIDPIKILEHQRNYSF